MLAFIIDLARQRGLKVVAVETPVPSAEDRELLRSIPAYTDLLHDLARCRQDIRVITFPRDDTDQRLFSGYVHLNKAGRRGFRTNE